MKNSGIIPQGMAKTKVLQLMAALLAVVVALACAGCTQESEQPQDQADANDAAPQNAQKDQAVSEDDGSDAAKGSAEAFVKELTVDHTYAKYDVTGDGHADKLEISTESTDEAFTSLKVMVNGKVVLVEKAPKDDPWYSLIANLVTTSNGKSLLDLECVNAMDVDLVNSLYLLGENNLQPVLDYQSLFDPSCGQNPFANVHSVKDNTLTVRANLRSYLLGSGFSCDFTFQVNDDGTVTPKDQTATNICYSLVPGYQLPKEGYLKTVEDLRGTRELGGAKVVTIASGHLLKPVSAQVLAGVLYIEFQMEDGTSFWISKTESGSPDFAEMRLPFEGLM